MALDLSKEEINHLLHNKRINPTIFKKIVAFFNKSNTLDFIYKIIDAFKNRLPCSSGEFSYLKKAIGFNYLSLLMHDELIETTTLDDKKLHKNKLNILYGDLLIIESIYYINKIKNELIKDFFFLKAKEIINAQFYLNTNVSFKTPQKNLSEKHLNSLLKKNWLTFPISLMVFLEKEKLNNEEIKKINQLINNLNSLYSYHEELLFLEKKWFFSKLTSMHFYLKKNHLLLFNQMIKEKKEKISPEITLELKNNLQKKINQLYKSVLNHELPSKFSLDKFTKTKKLFLKKITI